MTRQPGLPAYQAPSKLPPRVWEAVERTRSAGFELACIPEVGRVLQLFAGLAGVARCCELGTAYGVGAAWIESGLRPGAVLVTIELDPGRAGSARSMFADNPAVEVIQGDWSLALDRGPFDLVFSDGGPKRRAGDPEKLAPLVRAGGLLVLDDFSPGRDIASDESRRIWLESGLYRAVEVGVSAEASVILAVRR